MEKISPSMKNDWGTCVKLISDDSEQAAEFGLWAALYNLLVIFYPSVSLHILYSTSVCITSTPEVPPDTEDKPTTQPAGQEHHNSRACPHAGTSPAHDVDVCVPLKPLLARQEREQHTCKLLKELRESERQIISNSCYYLLHINFKYKTS